MHSTDFARGSPGFNSLSGKSSFFLAWFCSHSLYFDSFFYLLSIHTVSVDRYREGAGMFLQWDGIAEATYVPPSLLRTSYTLHPLLHTLNLNLTLTFISIQVYPSTPFSIRFSPCHTTTCHTIPSSSSTHNLDSSSHHSDLSDDTFPPFLTPSGQINQTFHQSFNQSMSWYLRK